MLSDRIVPFLRSKRYDSPSNSNCRIKLTRTRYIAPGDWFRAWMSKFSILNLKRIGAIGNAPIGYRTSVIYRIRRTSIYESSDDSRVLKTALLKHTHNTQLLIRMGESVKSIFRLNSSSNSSS